MRMSEMKDTLVKVFEHNLSLGEGAPASEYIVPMLESDPGIGKTSIVAQVAEHFEGELIEGGVRLAGGDPAAAVGWDIPTEDRSQMHRLMRAPVRSSCPPIPRAMSSSAISR